MTGEELVSLALKVLDVYTERSLAVLHPLVERGEGRRVVGPVAGKPEDEEIEIDTIGERILAEVVQEYALPCLLLGEHSRQRFTSPSGQGARVIFAIDPFDNSSQYRRRLDVAVYSVVGAYDAEGCPIGARAIDIGSGHVYCADGPLTYLRSGGGGDRRPLARSERCTFRDKDATIATYLGSAAYSLRFFQEMRGLLEGMAPTGILYGGGGAYIYALLASGAVDAYVMFDEPRGEIDPGLPLALAAGCTVVCVDPEGTYEDYRIEPERQAECVPFLVAACTPELRDEIISCYGASLC